MRLANPNDAWCAHSLAVAWTLISPRVVKSNPATERQINRGGRSVLGTRTNSTRALLDMQKVTQQHEHACASPYLPWAVPHRPSVNGLHACLASGTQNVNPPPRGSVQNCSPCREPDFMAPH
jgi:hypothetical protein